MTRRSPRGYTHLQFYIPDYMVEGLELWINHGVYPGDFLQAVLRNDLKQAVGLADNTNVANLPAYCAYLYNEAPVLCWGSKENVLAWHRRFFPGDE